MNDKLGRELKVGQTIAVGHYDGCGISVYKITGFTTQQVKGVELRWHRKWNKDSNKLTGEYNVATQTTHIKLPHEALILDMTAEFILKMLHPKPPMKVIFLDFDGVLNSMDYARRTRQIGDSCTVYDLDPDAGARIKKLVDLSGAKIVISSTWRINNTLAELQYDLESFGIAKEDVIGVTPRMNAERGYEIQAWLDKTTEEIESYVIIDDSSDMAHLLPRLVRTSWKTGFRDDHIDAALGMLSEPV